MIECPGQVVEKWVYCGTQQYGMHLADTYNCPYCGALHHVKYDAMPVMPYCWECRRPILIEDDDGNG